MTDTPPAHLTDWQGRDWTPEIARAHGENGKPRPAAHPNARFTVAATMGSETTAAAGGVQDAVRRDPFAMLPLTGYHMSDYLQHGLDLGRKLASNGAWLPGICCVNWFRKGEDGHFVWPGYGENMRVLKWVLERVQGPARGHEHGFGISPGFDDLCWAGLDFSPEQFDRGMSLDAADWQRELALHDELFERLAHQLPDELKAVRERLGQRMAC
jgi:phosphoenolpyruvate carboxykinase (GTP)